jgi:two-component system, OmpR family, phosphate regulon response regulator PhoB
MHSIDILITNELAGGMDPFRHGDIQIAFHQWTGADEVPFMEGALWVFVDGLGPENSGTDICRRLRCNPMTTHAFITIVVDDDPESKRLALRSGADDYIVGPIDRRKLLDRVLSVNVRNTMNGMRWTVELADLTVDLTAMQARWKEKALQLPPNEFRLLRFFAEHPGVVFTRSQLIAALGKESQIDERRVDNWVLRLRRALESAGAAHKLRTVRLLGYVLEEP